ncbi:MAG: hypothetical protein LC732_10155 [Acidobacteria bacterium]|nr:hypothetical protein [Acidobacteriota bacterium]
MTCDSDRIYALFENSATADVETESHLGSCPECMELYGSVVEFTSALDDPDVWGGEVVFMPSVAEPTAGLDILVAESIRLEDERARGFDHVATLLDVAPDGWHAYLRRIDGVCTVGLVDALLDEARKRASAPREFERIADLAIEVSEALDPRSYPAGMVARARGNAWKDRANALRLRGEFQDALWALDEAERQYRQQPIPEFDLATADYVRATVLVETDERYRYGVVLLPAGCRTLPGIRDDRGGGEGSVGTWSALGCQRPPRRSPRSAAIRARRI